MRDGKADCAASIGWGTLSLGDHVKCLGVLVEKALLMERQVSTVARTAFFHLYLIYNLILYLDPANLTMQINATVTQRLD